MIIYLTWQARLIRPRPRDVVIWPEVLNSPHYAVYETAIDDIRKEFEAGQDINGRLSKLARKRAYSGSPPRPATLPQAEWLKAFWRDKDRTRVTLDVHHLHMGQRDANGIVARTGPLLFVGIMPDTAVFLTIGDHNSFNDGTISKLMTNHLHATVARNLPTGGAFLAGPGVTLGGTQTKDTFRAINLVKQLKTIDAELTARGFPDPAQKAIRMDLDRLVVIDTPTGRIDQEIAGLL
jgi:hypothetical protein